MGCSVHSHCGPGCGDRCHLKRKRVNHETEICSICLDPIFKNVKVDCGHKYCQQCIFNWMYENNTCPLCRTPIEDEITIWQFTKNGINSGKLLRMQEYSACLDNLSEIEQDLLFIAGLLLDEYVYQPDWEEIKVLVSQDILDKIEFEVRTILVKTSCAFHRSYFVENNDVFYFY